MHVDNMMMPQMSQLKNDTYLTCISEHDPSENDFGRLSMWRAYGSIAIVLNTQLFMREAAGPLHVYSSPVNYHTPASFAADFKLMVDRFEHDLHFTKAQNRELVWQWVWLMLRQMVVCSKHLGFREEREWRVIYSPSQVNSPLISKEIEVVRNIAQPVVKLRLQNIPEQGLVGLDIASLVTRIIIGPTNYPAAQREAFVMLLAEAGVVDAHERVIVSEIPLRQ